MDLQAHDRAATEVTREPSACVFRPVQYLGCKLRSLTAIVDAITDIAPPSGRAVDLFTGTSVVAQGLAVRGHQVVALDVMGYSATFARATLGVDRPERWSDIRDTASVVCNTPEPAWYEPWLDWALEEELAIATADGDALLAQAVELPQIWRPAGASRAQLAQFARLSSQAGHDVAPAVGIASSHYAGTYFGIRQALELDRMRAAIASLRKTQDIDSWSEAALLTALLSAASACAFSAGKHFAQAHRIRDGKDKTFLRQRVVADRSRDVREVFAGRLDELLKVACPPGEKHAVIQAPFETWRSEMLEDIDVVYADPPYTAQQYSRFYHVLEVLVTNRVPLLQRVRGEVTRGLYPEGRFLSRFCSKRAAVAAFTDLLELVDDLGAGLVLSYSASKTGSTGNDRMISLNELLVACTDRLSPKRVRLVELGHVYRQFNQEASAVQDRADGEYLIICDA
ncbi:MAG: hypothetical protein ACRD2X_03095 [Vicinamibacteraceae bacterium]